MKEKLKMPEMKPCVSCGRMLPVEARFCPYCTNLQIEEKAVSLPDIPAAVRRKRLLRRGIAVLAVVCLLAAGIGIFGYRKAVQARKEKGQLAGTRIGELLTLDGHAYFVVEDRKSWEEAESYCEAQGGHLACITSAQEWRTVEMLLDESLDAEADEKTMPGFWIGGYKEDNVWHWLSGEAFSYSHWEEGEPNSEKETDMAVKVYGDTLCWDDCWPTELHPFVCEWDAVGDVPSGLRESAHE